MTAFDSKPEPFSIPQHDASRKDVLGVAMPWPTIAPTWPSGEHMQANLQKLQALGFEVRQQGQLQWTLHRFGSSAVIHLYGSTELELFTRHRAEHYSSLMVPRDHSDSQEAS